MTISKTRAIEVQVAGLPPVRWAKLRRRLTALKAVEFVSAASGLFYVRSRAAAGRIAQAIRDRGYAVATQAGRLESGGGRAFVPAG